MSTARAGVVALACIERLGGATAVKVYVYSASCISRRVYAGRRSRSIVQDVKASTQLVSMSSKLINAVIRGASLREERKQLSTACKLDSRMRPAHCEARQRIRLGGEEERETND